ncbi:APC family permease [Litorimonas sp. WD9-15]|uniref:APC family permease n=1 Tax=Litorimonas sp. WD9-15 TaxID=3418716 RepID=UPI003CFF19F7
MTRTTFTPRTAMAIIIANMVGVGVFTALGYQLADIDSLFAIIMLWVIGGLAALCGALSYAELGASLPRSGGEYTFLGEAYHPAAGFISGWVSATIGFAAPTAVVAIAFADYTGAILPGGVSPLMQKIIAVALVVILAALHARSRHVSGATQTIFTAVKIALITAFILAAFLLTAEPQILDLAPKASDPAVMMSIPYGIALIYVSYAYTGWNAATYVSGEMSNPQKDLPRVLFLGTALVTVLYVLLNLAFLYAAPVEAMQGKVEIGYIAAEGIFGETGGRLVGGMLALLLISTVSAMTLAGPRALQAIGEDYHAMRWLSKSTVEGVPWLAICFQAGIAIFFILSSTFDEILVFAGSMLAFNSLLAIVGLFVLRWRQPDLPRPYKTWGYPIVPLIYLTITAVTLVFVILDRPKAALGGLALIAVGFLFWFLTRNLGHNRRNPRHD